MKKKRGGQQPIEENKLQGKLTQAVPSLYLFIFLPLARVPLLQQMATVGKNEQTNYIYCRVPHRNKHTFSFHLNL